MQENWTVGAKAFMEAVADRVLIYDGAMGTQLQEAGLSIEDFRGKEGANDYLVLTRPDLVRQVHAEYFAAGADVVETNTFGANRLKLDEYELGHLHDELNMQAARLAREAGDEATARDGKPRFVSGSMGPTGMLPSSSDPALSQITFEELATIYRDQAAALVAGGVDVLLIETSQDILEVKAALTGIARAFQAGTPRVAVQAQVTLDVTGRMLLGTDLLSAYATIAALPCVDLVGLNCSTGPEHMREPVRLLAERAQHPICIIPNAGLPLNVDGKAFYPEKPEPFAKQLASFVEDLGVQVVGGCCGTTPEHIRALAQAVGGKKHAKRSAEAVAAVSSGVRATSLHQEPKPLLMGERVNAQGSKKAKEALLAGDYDAVLEIAREQVEGGAHVLDVCVALTERADEAAQMREVVRKLSQGVDAPLMIDSTEANVILEALRNYPGRAIINSINLENGRERCEAILPMAVEHGAAVVALTIDPIGMAKTAQRKLEVAQAIYDIAVKEYGLPPEALIFDALTFTLATGEEEFLNSAIETLEGIKAIKAAMPGVLTTLGVSNVSFGLNPAARHVLNSVFLYHAVKAGLDTAIVNPSHVKPFAEISAEHRELAEDLVFNRRADALPRYIEAFQGVSASSGQEKEDPTASMTAEEAVHWMIVHRKKQGIEALLDQCLTRRDAVSVLNQILLPAMKEVGDKFGSGELILPFVLQSAEVMKKAVAHVEQFLDKAEGATKGKVVLATVYGDVHDIGKNLVNTILSNNGYTVYDLGKQVPINTILAKAEEVGADAIGLSALLVSTSKQMGQCIAELARRDLKFPVIVGGAAINQRFGLRIAELENGQRYEPGVFYANDAFEGLATMERLVDPTDRPKLLEELWAKVEASKQVVRAPIPVAPEGARSSVQPAPSLPTPPFWGWKAVKGIPMVRVFDALDKRSLYRLSWGARNTHGEAYDKLVAEEFEPRLARMLKDAQVKGWLQPAFVYGYFPANSDGNRIVVYHPERQEEVLATFTPPRQPEGDFLCLADYVAPMGGPKDVIALQVATVGSAASEAHEALQKANDYGEAYFLHGLSVEAAEAVAEIAHQHIRSELGLAANGGKRYSWGYPAIPDLNDHEQVWKALPVEAELGVSLTESFQLVPEQSTAAIVLHHPEAKYYQVRGAVGALGSA